MTTEKLNTLLAACIVAKREAEEALDTTKEGLLACNLGDLAQAYINTINIGKR